MDYAFTVTDAGRYLIARLMTEETMHITKVMVGKGRVPDNVRLASLTDLVDPVAPATSNAPHCDRGVAYMTVEYNSALNGGLAESFWLNEFGLFALDPAAGEVMIAYGTLGDIPQFVKAYEEGKGVDVRRFPIAVAIGEDRGMVVDYHTDLWLTAEDLEEYYSLVIQPLVVAEIGDAIDAHNKDPQAHFEMERILNLKVFPRLALAEALEELDGASDGDHEGYENEYITVFDDLDDVNVQSGNWNNFLCRIEF